MVSDRPFRAPQAEELEETNFGTLGLLDDLVGAMGEFGERKREATSRKTVVEMYIYTRTRSRYGTYHR